MYKPFGAKFIGKNEKCLFLLKSPILTTYRAQATRHKRAACLCMYRGLATPNRKRTVARFFYSINFPCGCGGSQIFRIMKGITLFSAICFCLWFLSEIALDIGWTMQLLEQNTDMTLESMFVFIQNNIARTLASLSGTLFFFTLFLKQLKRK